MDFADYFARHGYIARIGGHRSIHGFVDIRIEIMKIQNYIQVIYLTPSDTFLNICKRLFIELMGNLVIKKVSAYRQPDVVESPISLSIFF